MTPIKYLWRIHGERWERAFDKISTNTIKGVHQKFLGAADSIKKEVIQSLSRYRKKR